jgi:hypothetical protein
MEIISATYGDVDCTEIVKSKVSGQTIVLRASNDLIGDTQPGVVKFLNITLNHQGIDYTESVKEGNLFTYPKSNNNKLGIFYSNNNNPKIFPAIDKSLQTIKEASEGIADIITCVWNPIPTNPFVELRSWYTSQSHLNQLLQIMQCLYSAREIKEYEYVSFLEHDVLYPKGYFDYPDFKSGQVITNMNYGGLHSTGWQERNQDDEPFHQMTMRFDDAIRHCERILPNALRTNSGMIETQTMGRLQWRCDNEAMHINHGIHFTSHNSIYSKSKIYSNHSYWGKCIDYSYLFQ